MELAVIIMAAGKGTRMKSDLPKVLHRANGRPLVEYVLDTALSLDPEKIVVIVGHQAELVKKATARYGIITALQEPQLGTGHAVMQTEALLNDFNGEVLLLSGDAPLVNATTLQELIAFHRSSHAAATVLTAELHDPTGYGRVIRELNSDSELAVREINSGVYVFDTRILFEALGQINTNNAQQEYYLTDVFGICFQSGKKVCAFKTDNPDEILGINTPEQLAEAERLLITNQKYPG
jgi:UDP-N-acetylglucosamine pyrophosphorylase